MRVLGRHCAMTLALIALSVVVFFGQLLMPQWALERFDVFFGLSVPGLLAGRWWQFVTYAFLHGNSVHLLLNMVGLWFAGRLVERVIGPWRFLLLYLFTAVAGGIFQILFTGGNQVLIGASGSVFGIMIAFTTMYPNSELFVLLFFVIPLRLRAKILGWAVFLFALAGQVGSSFGYFEWVGHAAHLGGCIGGFLFARLSGFSRPSALEAWIARRYRAIFSR